MARRRLLAGIVLAAGSLAGAVAYRRRFSGRRERVDLYYEDGAMVSLEGRSPEGERLLPLARDVLRAART
jgi:hypothetical protein